MKLLLLACLFLTTTVYANVFHKVLSFCNCGELGWKVDEYTADWQENGTIITMNVISKMDAKNPGLLHKVQINMSNCESKDLQDCLNSTTVHVSNVSCSNHNITAMDRETCNVAMMIVDRQMRNVGDDGMLKQIGGFCICGKDEQFDANGSDAIDDSNQSAQLPHWIFSKNSGSLSNSDSSNQSGQN